ncbi:type II secretion system protein [Halapricum sp. CBA1109]|uniref:type II secretion system F family protein n=1 Tax=Halapricum sp. CBA1109 TaxID=2668068 RepID=UPI0012FBD696|nr:type II secretion system F family protein [Halapricum sp. CBA1109]MUV88761.1 type II secretion system protein [Halapricum sp. CBA1109]
MAVTSYLPLAVAAALAGLLSLAAVVPAFDRVLSRLASLWFGRFVTDSVERRRTLQAAYSETTYRVYTAKTLLYTVVVGGIFGIVGVYLIAGVLIVLPAVTALLAQLPSVMGEVLGNPNLEIVLSTEARAALYVVSGLVLGGLGATGTYVMRWQLPKSTAEVRRRSINEALPRTVAFMYALSRGGTAFPTVMRTLGDNTSIYGEAAAEVNVGVREMTLFNTDIITAVRRVSYRTPSEKWKTFTENLASVLQSGQSLPAFLEQQYDRFQEDAEERQEEILELLATIAEAYVTTLVAGSLFLITILLVFGLTTTDTLLFIQLLVYLIIPLANAGFVVFLMQKLEQLGVARESGVSELETDSPSTTAPETDATGRDPSLTAPDTKTTSPDGGTTAGIQQNLAQLALYDRLRRVKRILGQPLQTVLWHPTRILYVTVPLALLWVVLRGPAALASEGVSIRVLDDVLIQALLFLLGTFAVVRQLYKRRIDRIEAATPEMLERLASLNDAGMSIVESLDRIRDTDLGVLTSEIERIWADVTMGANTDEALVRFGRRVRTTSIARVVTLVTNAMRASGSLGPVLRIASEQARSDMRLRRQRRQQMFTYLVVIYISFAVFLVIIVAVKEVLVPSLPNTVPTPDSTNRLGVNVEQFARIGSVDKAAYTLVFFHAAMIQAICSGFIAGQLGDGTVKDGAKHAAAMLGIAYVAFLLLSSPVASMDFVDQTTAGEEMTVQSASLSDGGFVVLRQGGTDGEMLGHSEYLPAGTHTDVRIQLDRPPSRDLVTVYAVPHLDENDNEAFDGNATDGAYPEAGFQVSVSAEVTYTPETDDGADDAPSTDGASTTTADNGTTPADRLPPAAIRARPVR